MDEFIPRAAPGRARKQTTIKVGGHGLAWKVSHLIVIWQCTLRRPANFHVTTSRIIIFCICTIFSKPCLPACLYAEAPGRTAASNERKACKSKMTSLWPRRLRPASAKLAWDFLNYSGHESQQCVAVYPIWTFLLYFLGKLAQQFLKYLPETIK